MTTKHRIYTMTFSSVYPHYVAKAEKKDRTKAEVDTIIRWLTGYTQRQLSAHLKKKTNFEAFFNEAPQLNPSRALIKGVVCGVRVEDVEDPLMREFVGAQGLVRVTPIDIFPNCPRYIPDLAAGKPSPYVPRDGQPPIEPGWKSNPAWQEVVPPRKV